jgi:hypothetical protein
LRIQQTRDITLPYRINYTDQINEINETDQIIQINQTSQINKKNQMNSMNQINKMDEIEIKLEDGGPIFYREELWGRGETF